MPLRLRPLLAYMALPYVRKELPGWGKLLRPTGVHTPEIWRDAPVRTIRGKLHGLEMQMDLRNWSDRQSYFLGRFYDLPTQLLLIELLRAGETFVDVGANIGMITLLASHLAGPTGHVHAVEPNPLAFARLKRHVDANHLQNVALHPLAFSDASGETTLTVVDDHSGSGTLATVNGEALGRPKQQFTVPVARADDVLPTDMRTPVTVKIDVEGFECNVIKGMRQLISRHRPAMILEVVESHLRRAGSSLGEMFDLMHSMDCLAYQIGTRKVLTRHHLCLCRCTSPKGMNARNLLWLPADSHFLPRIQRFIAHVHT